jgi:hypothetical protein
MFDGGAFFAQVHPGEKESRLTLGTRPIAQRRDGHAYAFTIGQPPSFSGRQIWSAGKVASSL